MKPNLENKQIHPFLRFASWKTWSISTVWAPGVVTCWQRFRDNVQSSCHTNDTKSPAAPDFRCFLTSLNQCICLSSSVSLLRPVCGKAISRFAWRKVSSYKSPLQTTFVPLPEKSPVPKYIEPDLFHSLSESLIQLDRSNWQVGARFTESSGQELHLYLIDLLDTWSSVCVLTVTQVTDTSRIHNFLWQKGGPEGVPSTIFFPSVLK